MLRFLILLLQTIIYTNAFGQQATNKYSCNCSKIGLDTIWADTNKVSCYLVPVERNFKKPRGQKYFLAVASAPALSKSAKEPLLYLHGGPGIATLSNFPRYLRSKTFSRLRENHALVFFDYRGTGFSEPVLCKDLGDSVDAITNAGLPLEERIIKTTAAYTSCKEEMLKQGIQVSDFSSLQSAADAETIRAALGINAWNIYSVSHGTTVALNMMRSFPGHIRSVILDSPFPTNAPWMDFIRPFDTAFKVLEKKLAEDPAYTAIFPSVKHDLIKIAARLQKTAFLFPVKQGKDSITRMKPFSDGDFVWSVWSAMLNPYYIPLIPLALKEMASGNDSVLLRWALLFNDPDAFGKFALAQSKAILYYESKPRFEEETETYLLNKYPDYAGFIIPGMEASLYTAYRPESPPPEYFNPVKTNIPTLIFSGEYDPVCPPLFANITAELLTNSTVVIVPAASHAAMYADDCTRGIAKDFFLNPDKKPGTMCLSNRKKIDFITSDILRHLK
jgi:pimeloyl-ACP methyl ester carboxylesterase